MALSGRTALAALTGALLVLAFRSVAALLVVNLLLAAAIVADLALAAGLRRLRITWSGDTRVLLGETAAVTVTVRNPAGGRCGPRRGRPGRRARTPCRAGPRCASRRAGRAR